jgi:hypothetical protein
MIRLILAGLLVSAASMPALAQGSCRTMAEMQRDLCNRQTGGDIYAGRRCMESYLSALNRCMGADPPSRPTPPKSPSGKLGEARPPTLQVPLSRMPAAQPAPPRQPKVTAAPPAVRSSRSINPVASQLTK